MSKTSTYLPKSPRLRSIHPFIHKIKNMRFNPILLLLFLMALPHSYAQVSDQDIFAGEVTKMVNIPNSPEAEAFGKYGDIQVNMYSGVPQISIPIHVIPGREMDLPLTLTYDASGILVEQMASWVGLGWNLNVGGRISRVVNGLPDDYFAGAYQTIFNNTTVANQAYDYTNNIQDYDNPQFDTAAEAQEYVEFLYDISKNNVEVQLDYFTLNVPGINGTIVMDVNDQNKPKVLNNPRIKVQAIRGVVSHIDTWKVTGEDGTQYFFDESETTDRNNLSWDQGDPLGDANTKYASSWLLTKIISPNGKDVFEFQYNEMLFWDNALTHSAAATATTELRNNQTNYLEPAPLFSSGITYNIKQQFLSTIKHNNKILATVVFGQRHDVNTTAVNTRLSGIDFFDINGNDLKSVTIDNDDYFNLDNQVASQAAPYSIRLKLNGLQFKGKLGGDYQDYAFEYERPDDVPARSSTSQDYFGYYNGSGNNTLFPAYNDNGITIAGANREPDAFYARTGMLTKITYPTKGHTSYTYESHEYSKQVVSTNPIFPLAMNHTQALSPTPNWNIDDNNMVCDNLPINNPRVTVASFTIPASTNPSGFDIYSLTLAGTSGVRAMLADPAVSATNNYKDFCDFEVGPTIDRFNIPVTENIVLAPGKYKAMLLSADNSVASLTISRQVTTTNNVNTPIGGNRIAKITDYTKNGEIAMTKKYTYEKDGISTAIVNYQPIFHSIRSSVTSTGGATFVETTTAFPKGNEPQIVYESVVETKVDGSDQAIGSSEYEFYTGPKGVTPNTLPPFEPRFSTSLKVGNVNHRTDKDENGDMVAKQTTEYYQTLPSPINLKGLVVFTDDDHFEKSPYIKEVNPSGSAPYFIIEYLNNFECFGNCVPPAYWVNPQAAGYEFKMDTKYGPYAARTNYIRGGYGGVSKVRNESVFRDDQNNETTVSSEEITAYDTDPMTSLYRPRSKTIIDSESDTYTTSFYYPDDLPGGANDDLVSKNDLAEVVKTETIKNPGTEDLLVSLRENTYQSLGSNGVVVPVSVKTKKAAYAEEDRMDFTFYGNGNLKTATKADGITTVYVWGYDDMYPVAKIENATYAAVEGILGTNFDLGSNGLTTTQANSLRSGLTTSMVNTYAYDPMVGVTSMTDPKGYTMNYHYDEFNRLKEVKDAAGNLVSDYQYNYRAQ